MFRLRRFAGGAILHLMLESTLELAFVVVSRVRSSRHSCALVDNLG